MGNAMVIWIGPDESNFAFIVNGYILETGTKQEMNKRLEEFEKPRDDDNPVVMDWGKKY